MQNDRVFEHHMLHEIHEQPRAVGDTIAEHLSEYRKTGRISMSKVPWTRSEGLLTSSPLGYRVLD